MYSLLFIQILLEIPLTPSPFEDISKFLIVRPNWWFLGRFDYILWIYLIYRFFTTNTRLNYIFYNILPTNWLIYSSQLPKSPPSLKYNLTFRNPPVGAFSLNGHKNELTSLKYVPIVKISWIRSSMQIILNFFKFSSIISFELRRTRWPLILQYPRLYIKFRTVVKEGYPNAI